MSSKRHKTQQPQIKDRKVDQKRLDLLEKIIEIASYQKLLPKFLYEMDAKCSQGRKKRFLQYQKIVKNLYGQECKSPLKYDPEEAMTDQEKLQQIITKLQNHQLQIDYFDKVKTKNGNFVPVFKPSHQEKLNHPTKKEFLIFRDFNQKKFTKSYSQIFDDKLQLKHNSLLRKQRVKTVAFIPEQQHQESSKLIPKPKFNKFQIEKFKQKQIGLKKIKKIKLMPLSEHIASESVNALPTKQANRKYKPHIEKTKIGKMLNDIETSVLYGKMLKIGSFPVSVLQNSISLTKQSLVKYLKFLYEREVRMIDFLQVKPAFSLESYTALCTKLKLMQVDHILFMTFLFYDFNNDGYICENDIRRLKSLVSTKKNRILEEDLKLIEGIKQKRQYEAKVLFQQDSTHLQNITNPNSGTSNYLELYKLPEVTESTYFNWLKRQSEKKSTSIPQEVIAKEEQKLENQIQEAKQQREKEKKSKINPFNPSVLKFKFSYFQQKAEVRKYIMGIKATKIYIGFDQFRTRYQKWEESRQMVKSVQSRVIQNSKMTKQLSKNESSINSSRYDQSRSQVKIDMSKKEFKFQYQESIQRPYLWYDLMDKLAGIRYEGLKYD